MLHETIVERKVKKYRSSCGKDSNIFDNELL